MDTLDKFDKLKIFDEQCVTKQFAISVSDIKNSFILLSSVLFNKILLIFIDVINSFTSTVKSSSTITI